MPPRGERARVRRVVTGLVAFALVASACSGPADEGDLTVFGPYVGAEADIFGSVLESFERETGITTTYVGSGNFQADFGQRIASADLPDILVLPQPALLERLNDEGRTVPLAAPDGRFVLDTIGPSWADAVTADGAIVAVPYRFVLKSLVWYRADVFAERGYALPSSLDELSALEATMIADGETPWCSGMDDSGATGWWATDRVEDLVLRRAGADTYRSWSHLETPFTDDAITGAMQDFQDRMLRPGGVDGGARSILNVSVVDAIRPMFDEPPGCLMHKQASFQSLWIPKDVAIGDGRLDVFALPAATAGPPPVMVSGELVASTTEDPAAGRLLRFLLDDRAFTPWEEVGGSLAARSSPDPGAVRGALDQRVNAIVNAADTIVFDASDVMTPEVGTGSFYRGMIDLIAGRPARDVGDEIQRSVPSPAALDPAGSSPTP